MNSLPEKRQPKPSCYPKKGYEQNKKMFHIFNVCERSEFSLIFLFVRTTFILTLNVFLITIAWRAKKNPIIKLSNKIWKVPYLCASLVGVALLIVYWKSICQTCLSLSAHATAKVCFSRMMVVSWFCNKIWRM